MYQCCLGEVNQGYIQFRVKSKGFKYYRTVSINTKNLDITCDCPGFDRGICRHIDATLYHGERHMVHADDVDLADKAMKLVEGKKTTPSHFKSTWKRDSVWRGVADPRPRNNLPGAKVCFTGKAANGLTRKDLIDEAISLGWNAVSNYQNNMKYVVASHPDSGSKKIREALKSGAKVISYDDWEAIKMGGS